MALEKRDGNLYYYRSMRDRKGRPRTVYLGTGELARIVYEQDAIRRAAEEAEADICVTIFRPEGRHDPRVRHLSGVGRYGM
jgi:hypothetical protein